MKNLSHEQKEAELLSRNKLLPPLKIEGNTKKKSTKPPSNCPGLKNIDLYSGSYINLKD
ncbi:hypothetical protein [Acinetobacter sp. AS167]|uniref:hypothetical protein n=1 Tax=Acinetobacter sp. AS167 TaxID=3127884 RepID=UPI00301AF1D6